jgi:hypothetical protein
MLPGIVKAQLSRHPDDVRAQHQRDLAAGPAGSSYRPPCRESTRARAGNGAGGGCSPPPASAATG